MAFVIGDKAYCGSGLSPWFSAFGDFRILDMSTDQWSTISDLPADEQRQYAVGFSGNGMGYVFGGVDGNRYFRNVLEYNPLADSWTTKTSLPDSGISGAASFTINKVAYIICGRTAQKTATNTVWAYDITNDSWQQKASFPFGNRWRAAGASLNGKGYLIFGADSANNLQNEFYKYDPATDSWSALPPFPGSGRNYSGLTAINGQLVVFGGIDSAGVYHNDLWRYNPISQTWHQQNALPASGRKGGLAFTNGPDLYYTTGINSNSTRLNETWKCKNPVIGLAENDLLKFELYPNPVKDFLHVHNLETGHSEASELTLYDFTGKVILRQNLTKSSFKISVENLNPGIYLLEITTSQKKFSKKIITL